MPLTQHPKNISIDTVPVPMYTTDADGLITGFNQAAVDFAGRAPRVRIDRWCVTWKLFTEDGRPLPHEECPMAIALKTRRAIRGVTAIAESPSGKRTPFVPYPTPTLAKDGALLGGFNILIDLTPYRKIQSAREKQMLGQRTDAITANLIHALMANAAQHSDTRKTREVWRNSARGIEALQAADNSLSLSASGLTSSADELVRCIAVTAIQDAPTFSLHVVSDAAEIPAPIALPLALIGQQLVSALCKSYGPAAGAKIAIALRRDLQGYNLTVNLSSSDGRDEFSFQAPTIVIALARASGGQVEHLGEAGLPIVVTIPNVLN